MSKVVGQNENNKNEIKIENLAGKEISEPNRKNC